MNTGNEPTTASVTDPSSRAPRTPQERQVEIAGEMRRMLAEMQEQAQRLEAERKAKELDELRDYFAARAPLSILDNPEQSIKDAAAELGVSVNEWSHKTHYYLLLAKKAYAFADAMMLTRKDASVSREGE